MKALQSITEWDVLGIYLGLDESEITEIERDHHSNARRRIAMLAKWMEKDVTDKAGTPTEGRKVLHALLSQIHLLLLLAPSQPSLILGDFLEMETLGDNYLQLVIEAESAVEESNPPLKKHKQFSQCFMNRKF